MDIASPAFWTALGSIVVANLLLSGDNAVIIALAARRLPVPQQRQAVLFGGAAAIVMRIVLTLVAVQLLDLPGLKAIGGALLLWIGVKLLLDDPSPDPGAHLAPVSFGAAVRTILVADLVMSLDNVLAVAAAARGSWLLLMIGLVLSVPLIIYGSSLLLRIMDRVPLLIDAGAALLGWLAGSMIVLDPLFPHRSGLNLEAWATPAGALCAVAVVVGGRVLRHRIHARRAPGRT